VVISSKKKGNVSILLTIECSYGDT